MINLNINKNIIAVPADLWVQRIRDFKTICAKRMLTKMETEISMSINNMKDPNASIRKLDSVQKKIMDDTRLKSQLKQKALEDQFEEFKRQTKDLLGKEDSYEIKLEKQEHERIEFEQKKMQEEVKRESDSARKLLNDMKAMADADSEYKVKEIQ